MIHSLSGGVIKRQQYYNIAKVELPDKTVAFYTYDFPLFVGDRVLVKYQNSTLTGTVLALMPNTPQQNTPFSVKHLKSIIGKAK